MDVEIIVRRPEELWDTRAPLGVFYLEHRRQNEVYYSVLLAIERSRRDLLCAPPEPLKRLFCGSESNSDATRAWGGLRGSVPATGPNGQRPPPASADVERHLQGGVAAITEHAIVNHCGIFEQYVQIWTLNYLLALLENGTVLDSRQLWLIKAISPLRGSKPLPSLPTIAEHLPVLKEELGATPHVFRDYGSGDLVIDPASEHQTAYAAINFWREWRNLVVHNRGIATQRFIERQTAFAADAGVMFPAIRDLRAGKRLRLDQDTFRPFMTVHWKAAQHLRAVLLACSGERRGHALAPEPFIKFSPGAERPENLPPLLMTGDHEASVCASRP
jgi:hypothetical protein